MSYGKTQLMIPILPGFQKNWEANDSCARALPVTAVNGTTSHGGFLAWIASSQCRVDFVRSGKQFCSQVVCSLCSLSLSFTISCLGFGFEGRGGGWQSTLLKSKSLGELPSLLSSWYFTKNLLWPGSAARTICPLLENAYINYQMNLTGSRSRQL